MERHYKAFISYRHLDLDKKVAKQLHKYLEHYNIPKDLRKDNEKHLGLVFRDEDELPLSCNLSESIRTALDNSEFLIVICTPETSKSKWVISEITYFIEKHGRDHVLAVLASGNEKTSFPNVLTVDNADDANELKEIEPLAANLSAQTERERNRLFKKESLRLISALIGCSFDDLYKREQRYRRKRTLVLLSIVLIVLSIYTVTLIVDNHRIREEEENSERQLHETQVALSKLSYQKGDYRGALNYAYQALSSKNDRTFAAEAEAQLNKVLHLYSKDSFVYTQSIEQETKIDNAIISSDGKKILTKDASNVLRVFDYDSAKELWEKEIANLYDYQFSEDGTIIVVSSGEDVIFYDSENGEILRNDEKCHPGIGSIKSNYYLTSDEITSEFFIKSVYSGEIKNKIKIDKNLTEGKDLTLDTWALSKSGKTAVLVCHYFSNIIDDSQYVILVWECDSETFKMIPIDEMDTFTAVDIAFGEEDFAIATADRENSNIMFFECDNDWQMKYKKTISNNYSVIVNGDLVYDTKISAFGLVEDKLIYAIDRYICTIDLSTGDILAERNLSYQIMCARIMEKTVPIIMNDGSVSIYMTDGTLSSDANLYSFKAEQTVFGAEISGNKPLESIYAMSFCDSKNRISFVRYISSKEAQHFYDESEDEKGSNYYFSPNKKLMAGINYDVKTGKLSGALIETDTALSTKFSFQMDSNAWTEPKQKDVVLSNDGKLYVNGFVFDLKSQTIKFLDDKDEYSYFNFQCKSVYSKEKDDILTAILDFKTEELQIEFSDGTKTNAYPFPDSLRIDKNDSVSKVYVCEGISSSGNVLVSQLESKLGLGKKILKLFLFNLEEEKWIELSSEQFFGGDSSLTQIASCSENGKQFALLSNNGNIIMLNSSSGEELLKIDALGSSDEMRRMIFAKDDSILVVFCRSGEIKLFDTNTGEMVLNENLVDANYPFNKEARADYVVSNDGKKLFLFHDYNLYESFCNIIDLEKNASLGYYPAILFYFEDNNTLILKNANSTYLYGQKFLSLEEAMSKAEEILYP